MSNIIALRKYVACTIYDIYNIARKETTFTNPALFNDPIDSYFFNSNEKEFADIKKILTKEIMKKIKISCFFNHNEILKEKRGTKLSPTELLMWTHYADSHKGMCLEYEVENSHFDYIEPTDHYNSEKVFLNPVKYIGNLAIDYPQIFKEESEYQGFGEVIQTIYFAKDQAFLPEHEVRMLLFKSDSDDYIPYPFDFLKKIIFGYRCPAGTKFIIKNICKKIYEDKVKFKKISHSFEEVEDDDD